jgi:hypothetical protein
MGGVPIKNGFYTNKEDLWAGDIKGIEPQSDKL